MISRKWLACHFPSSLRATLRATLPAALSAALSAALLAALHAALLAALASVEWSVMHSLAATIANRGRLSLGYFASKNFNDRSAQSHAN